MVDKMYGSYSDTDLNDWERFPMNANVLTSSAFGAWLLRRDERRDKVILKADYENHLKADMVAMLDMLRAEIEQLPTSTCTETCRIYIDADDFKGNVLEIFDKYKAETEDKDG